jgi:hypothetical protein
MTTNDDLHITEPETSERITSWTHGRVLPRPWTHRAAVFSGCVSLGHVWRLPDGQWTTWRDGARFATAAEAAEELRRQHQDAASVHLDRDETTEDICRELRAAGLDPERMQRRVREIIDRVAAERRAR